MRSAYLLVIELKQTGARNAAKPAIEDKILAC
jgi:hypothetical protein